MSLPVRKIWNKLSRMSWDELRTRVGQEAGKRTEYALARVGLMREPRIENDRSQFAGKFFFSSEEIAGRVALLKEHLREDVTQTINEADELLQHRFRLLGYRDLDYGADIDWHLDAVHGKRAPLKPWYQVSFLDFEQVGDHKITWELNRHQHLVTLAKASLITGKPEYAQELQQQFYSWQKANPYPVGINWGSSLEAAFRSLSWLWVRALLGSTNNGGDSFDDDLLCGLARHGRYIERYLSTYFSPNTHLIGEAVALFFIGTLCPEISQAKRWQQKGLLIILDEAQRQVRPDGVYFEQSLYYHLYALDFFLHARILGARNGVHFPVEFDRTLRKMLEVLRVLCRNGAPDGFGDDDGGRVFNPRRNQAEHMSDPLALGACLFEDAPLPDSALLTEEAIWLLGEKAVEVGANVVNKPAPQLSSCAFDEGGLYVIASDGAHRAQMLVDAGPHGIGHGGHGHADALSVRLSLDGHRWLIDPGAYAYISPGDDRNQFRGTSAHNTLQVDKLDQAIAETPFSWRALPNVRTEDWQCGSRFTFFSGSHSGYERLGNPVLHRRMIFHPHGEYWLIRDIAEGGGVHDLELFWHFGPDVDLEPSGDSIQATRAGEQLMMVGASPGPWQVSAEQAWASPAYGQKITAPVAAFRTRVRLPAEHGTLLLPVSAPHTEVRFRVDADACDAAAYIYECADQFDHVVFGDRHRSWQLGSIRSDAAFLFLRKEGRDVALLAFCSAMFVEIDGHRIVSSEKMIERLEWTAGMGASASDPESLKSFNAELLRSKTSVI